MSQHFNPPRMRDAYASIRGYVYQVDLTVERWLYLTPGQSLELERGEDIDLVERLTGPVAGAPAERRLLEQVKHRDENITLRSPIVSEALANFHRHRTANPSVDLRLRLVTNAAVGREQLDPFPGRLAGITLWDRLRTETYPADQVGSAADAIRRFLDTLPKPAGLDKQTWTDWRRYLSSTTTADFTALVALVEWATGTHAAEGLPADVRGRLVTAGHCPDAATAEAVHNRLFMHVVRLLATPGVKRLTPDGLAELVARPALAADDRAVLDSLRLALADHADRLEHLEVKQAEIGHQLAVAVTGLLPGPRFSAAEPEVDVSVPAAVARRCDRSEAAARLAGLFVGSTWVAVHGGANAGKSQLAIPLAAEIGCLGWYRFRHDFSPAALGLLLDRARTQFDALASHRSGECAASRPFSACGRDGLIVLDDLPRMTGDEPALERLSRVVLANRHGKVRLLSTSQFPLPTRLVAVLDAAAVDIPTPPFTDDEARRLFRAFGSPAAIADGSAVPFVNALTGGHPQLLAATAEYLRDRDWDYSEAAVNALLRGDHTRRVMPEVIERLTHALDDPQRELLYRLTLPVGPFSDADATALAAVPQAVARPRERLNALLGAWVQADSTSLFVVSPLVKPLGRSELDADVQRECYRRLADRIMTVPIIPHSAGDRAIWYYQEAGEFGRAATLYVLALVAAAQERPHSTVVSTIDRWRDERLPAQLDIGTQLLVRAYQVAAFRRQKIDTTFVTRDIDDLLVRATDRDGWGIAAVAVNAVVHLRRDTRRVIRYVRRAIALPAVAGPDGRDIVFDNLFLPDLLWLLVADLTTPAALSDWLDAAESVSEPDRARFWSSDLAKQAVWLVPNKLYLTECEKPERKKNWPAVLAALDDLLTRARRLNLPRLEAAATRTTLGIHGDLKQFDRLAPVAEATLARWPDDPEVQFLVRGSWGLHCAYNRQFELARPQLSAALKHPCIDNHHERLRYLVAAGRCFAETDPAQDREYSDQARDLALGSDRIAPLEAANALAECGIAVFLRSPDRTGAAAAFPDWSAAMKRMGEVKSVNELWRDAVVLFGHFTGFLAQYARDGHPPTHTRDGLPWTPPTRGQFGGYREDRAAAYRPGGEAALFWLMSEYAEAARNDDAVDYWLGKATEESRRSNQNFARPVISLRSIPTLVRAERYEDVVEAAVTASRGMIALHHCQAADPDDIDGVGVDLSNVFATLPEDLRRQGDGGP